MSCSEMTELMQRHLDHDLTEVEQQFMFSHFNSCPECVSLFERLERVSLELESLPAVNPPYSIVDMILPLLDLDTQEIKGQEVGKVPAPKQHEPAVVIPFMRRKFLSKLVYGSTAAAALVLGVFLFQGTDAGLKDASGLSSPAAERETFELSGGADQVNGTDKGMVTPDSSNPALKKSPASSDAVPLVTPDSLSFGAMPLVDERRMDVKNQYGTASPTTDGTSLKKDQQEMNDSANTQDGSTSNTGDESIDVDTTASSDDGSKDRGIQDSFAGSGAFAEPAKVSSDNKVLFTPQDSIVQGLDSQGFATSDTDYLLSTNEKHEAVVENQRVLIRSRFGEIVFLSPTVWAASDTIQLSEWLNDFQLLYQVEKRDGTVLQYLIDISLKVETKK
ncbi:MAG: zf-HC2 domain-containing protein [Gorillibacterium sp.]|nr:zf-HC2 domain-containing protein [Gorillibacterium sp.]